MSTFAKLLQEAPIDGGDFPDVIDPARKRRFKERDHPLAKNPAYPDFKPEAGSKASNYEELLASADYQDIIKKLNSYASRVLGKEFKLKGKQDLFPLFRTFMSSLQKVKSLESGHRARLEQMAVDLVLDLPEFKAYREPLNDHDLEIRATLRDSVTIPTLDEVKQDHSLLDLEFQAAEIVQDMDLEQAKRRFINAMTQGSATSRNYAFHLVSDKLAEISPELVNLYGLVTAFAELQFFVVPDAMMFGGGGDGSGGEAAGFSRVTTEEGIPVITAEAVNFPVLVQEIIKGLMELTSRKGLPNDPKALQVAKEVDIQDGETYSIILGRPLWRRLLSQLELNEHDLTMFLYDKLVSLPATEFNQTMRAIQAGGPAARKVIQQLIAEIKVDMEAENRDDFEESSTTRNLLDQLVEDLGQDRVNFLKKRTKRQDKDIQDIAAAMDPTPNGKYMEWILRQLDKGDVRVGEDNDKVKEALTNFMRLSKLGNFTGSRNVLEYKTWGDLAEVLQANSKVVSKAEEIRGKERAGTKFLNRVGEFELYEVSTVEACSELFKSTSWCVKDPRFSAGSTYIGGGHFFLYVEKAGAPYVLVHPASGQAKDTFDRTIKEKVAAEIAPLFEPIYQQLRAKGEIEMLYLMAAPASMRVKDPELGYHYANKVLKKRFKEAEPVIAQSDRYGFLYAKNVIGAPWPEAEAAIATDAKTAYCYANEVLKGPFPAGEAAIATRPESAYWYWYKILVPESAKNRQEGWPRWPAAEKAIFSDDAVRHWYTKVTGAQP